MITIRAYLDTAATAGKFIGWVHIEGPKGGTALKTDILADKWIVSNQLSELVRYAQDTLDVTGLGYSVRSIEDRTHINRSEVAA